MTKLYKFGGLVFAGCVTALTTIYIERIVDFVDPPPESKSPLILNQAGQTVVKYPNAVELVSHPNLHSWGKGESSAALATATREQVSKGLKLPIEMSAMRLDYQISDIAFGGQGRKRSANVDFAIRDEIKGKINCGPETFVFRDDKELSLQIQKKLNGIVFHSFMGGNLSCG